jgi:hypothetical protein
LNDQIGPTSAAQRPCAGIFVYCAARMKKNVSTN